MYRSVALILALTLALSIGRMSSGAAAILIESTVGGEPVRLISDDKTRRVLIAVAGSARLVDLNERTIFYLHRNRHAEMVHLGDFTVDEQIPSGFAVEKLGPGPRIAGYATTRFHIRLGGEICSVIDANLGLGRQMSTAMAAVDMLDRISAVTGGESRSPCERIPFRKYRRIGWGLRVADQNAPVIETTHVDTDYAVKSGELELPEDPVDLTEQFWNSVRRGPL